MWIIILLSHFSFRRRRHTATTCRCGCRVSPVQAAGCRCSCAVLVTMGLDKETWRISWIVGLPWIASCRSRMHVIVRPARRLGAPLSDRRHVRANVRGRSQSSTCIHCMIYDIAHTIDVAGMGTIETGTELRSAAQGISGSRAQDLPEQRLLLRARQRREGRLRGLHGRPPAGGRELGCLDHQERIGARAGRANC